MAIPNQGGRGGGGKGARKGDRARKPTKNEMRMARSVSQTIRNAKIARLGREFKRTGQTAGRSGAF